MTRYYGGDDLFEEIELHIDAWIEETACFYTIIQYTDVHNIF